MHILLEKFLFSIFHETANILHFVQLFLQEMIIQILQSYLKQYWEFNSESIYNDNTWERSLMLGCHGEGRILERQIVDAKSESLVRRTTEHVWHCCCCCCWLLLLLLLLEVFTVWVLMFDWRMSPTHVKTWVTVVSTAPWLTRADLTPVSWVGAASGAGHTRSST